MIAGTMTRAPESVAELMPPELAAQLDRLDVVSRKLFAGKLQGERRSKRRGRSVEFDDYREYVAGDDLRHIDWNVFARLDRFFIKVFQEEEDLAVHLVIDASASMNAGEPNKLLVAARLAMALGYIGLVNNNRVLATVFGAGPLRRMDPQRGRRGTQRLGAFLLEHVFAGVSMGGEENAPAGPAFSAAIRTIAATPAGKGVTVVISDLLVPGGYEEGLRALGAGAAAGAMDVLCLQLLSSGELDPGTEGRTPGDAEREAAVIGDLRLTDVETGRAAEVTVTKELVAQYRRSVEKYIGEAAAFCSSRGMQHELVRSDSDLGKLLTGELRRRGLLR
ncbi:MAG: DUF58 domain-containing protein [Phycisphaerales bacterium]